MVSVRSEEQNGETEEDVVMRGIEALRNVGRHRPSDHDNRLPLSSSIPMSSKHVPLQHEIAPRDEVKYATSTCKVNAQVEKENNKDTIQASDAGSQAAPTEKGNYETNQVIQMMQKGLMEEKQKIPDLERDSSAESSSDSEEDEETKLNMEFWRNIPPKLINTIERLRSRTKDACIPDEGNTEQGDELKKDGQKENSDEDQWGLNGHRRRTISTLENVTESMQELLKKMNCSSQTSDHPYILKVNKRNNRSCSMDDKNHDYTKQTPTLSNSDDSNSLIEKVRKQLGEEPWSRLNPLVQDIAKRMNCGAASDEELYERSGDKGLNKRYGDEESTCFDDLSETQSDDFNHPRIRTNDSLSTLTY